MSTKYLVALSNDRYLKNPPVQGKRLSTTKSITRAYDFGTSANRIARDIKGASVHSLTRLCP